MNRCHIKIGTFSLCEFPLDLMEPIKRETRRLGIPPCCGHGSYRNAVTVATLLEELGYNVRVVPGGCPKAGGEL